VNVLIIGGTGLISTGIVKALLARKATVTVYNRGQTDDRLEPAVQRLHGDRNDFATFEKSFASSKYDAVIDMICFKPDQAASDIRAFAGKCGHFVFCSTVCTYGNTQTIVPTTEATPQRPHSEYGKNKLACEKTFLDAYHTGAFAGTGLTILRPSHTYGPGGSIINNLGWGPTFVDRLRKGKPILVSGDGHGLWQSAYSEDVGVGFAAALGRKACFGECYNIVADEVVTWDDYTRRTAEGVGAPPPKIVHAPTDLLLRIDRKRYQGLDEIFQFHGVYSNDKIHRDVPEFRNVTPYVEGVRRTVAWLDQHNKLQPWDSDPFEDKIIAAIEAIKV